MSYHDLGPPSDATGENWRPMLRRRYGTASESPTSSRPSGQEPRIRKRATLLRGIAGAGDITISLGLCSGLGLRGAQGFSPDRYFLKMRV
eukprot:1383695-Amorphochlora_amoeboformis.AAC.2